MKMKLKLVIIAMGLGLAGGFAASTLGHEEAAARPCCSQCGGTNCFRICAPEC
jgi:hypothetical protein